MAGHVEAPPDALPTMSGESDAFIAVEPALAKWPSNRIRTELFRAKAMAAVALGFAVLSLAILAAALPRLGSLQAPASLRGVVGLDAVRSQGQPAADQTSGYYRTYLESVVRSGMELDSEQMAVLPVGSLVLVAEARGRRARITKPVEGWMSLKTSDGVDILSPDMTYNGVALNATDFYQVLQSKAMRERNLRLQAASAKLTEMQRQLLESVNKLKAKGKELGRTSRNVGVEVKEKAPKVGEKFARSASNAFEKMVKTQDAQHVLRHLTHDKDLQHLFKQH